MSREPIPPRPWKEVRNSHPRWALPWVGLEWSLEWTVYKLSQWAFVSLLQIAGNFALVVTLVSYCYGADARAKAQDDARKARQYQAWQVINSAQGRRAAGGRHQALTDLYLDGVNLSGIDISRTWLQELRLPGAVLVGLNADSAVLREGDFRGADLRYASFIGADLSGVDFRGANLTGARLQGALLTRACLEQADLHNALLDGANLLRLGARHAKLVEVSARSADFFGSALQGAELDRSDLRGASIDFGQLDSVSITGTNLAEIVMNDGGEMTSALQRELERRGAVFTPGAPPMEPISRTPIDEAFMNGMMAGVNLLEPALPFTADTTFTRTFVDLEQTPCLDSLF